MEVIGVKMKLKTTILLLMCVCAIGYCVYANDILDLEFPKVHTNTCSFVQDKMFSMINEDRHLFNVPSAQLDYQISSDAISISENMPFLYILKPWDRFDYFVIKKSEWSKRYYSSPQTIFDTWTNTDINFRNNVRNRDYNRVGVGVSEDSKNYYIVIKWK